MKKTFLYISAFAFLAIVVDSCKKDDPFSGSGDEEVVTNDPPIVTDFEDDSFIGLHHNIFSKTCANSGCHDGNFPPDFRTIESSYNTLINQPIIKNNPNGDFAVRVLPGNADMSVLYQRMIVDIDGQSGIMPLVVDEGISDFNDKKEQYIENIRSWINKGALDIFGNPPATDNAPPGFRGLVGFNNSTGEKLPRVASTGIILVPFGVQDIQLFFAFADDDTDPNNFKVNKMKVLQNSSDFENGATETFNLTTGQSLREVGFTGDTVTYTHKVLLNLDNYPTLTPYYIQSLVQDSRPDTSKIPNDKSADYIYDYFSFRKQN